MLGKEIPMASRRSARRLAQVLLVAVTLESLAIGLPSSINAETTTTGEAAAQPLRRGGMYYIGSHYECGVFISGRWIPELYPLDGAFALVFDELDPPLVLYQAPIPAVQKSWRSQKWSCRKPREAGFTTIGFPCSGTRHVSVSCDHLGCCYW